MIERLALFGASGDLAGRYLLPALGELRQAGELPDGFHVVGFAREDWDDADFRRHAEARLDEHAPHLPAEAREWVVRSLSYRSALPADAPCAAYLALPQGVFASVIESLGDVSRIVVEKPFGSDLDSAVALNRLLADTDAYRVDHALGMATLQRLPELAGLWSSADVELVELLWEETLALEGRAAFYDQAGALKDVIQNHLLQVLCAVVGGDRLEVLRAVRPLRSRRARYIGYTEESGVDPQRETETFAEVEVSVDTDRWSGTRFVLRAGKALARQYRGAVVRLDGTELRIGIDGPEDVRRGSTIVADPPGGLSAYAAVLRDILSGGNELSVSAAEVEEQWRIVTPVLDAWANGEVPLEEYAAGSRGPGY
jgi:glucose-6-phosphate 1-dehydrogenase